MSIHYPVIVVGGGMAGLTAAAYLSKQNRKVLVIEKEPSVGGLLGSFETHGFTFDKGARSIESSGIIFPMLKDLGIHLDWVKSPVTMEIDGHQIVMNELKDIDSYHHLLNTLYPQEHVAIQRMMEDIHIIMQSMDVLYGIDNPLFMQMPPKMSYLTKELIPWLFKLIPSLKKVDHYMEPVIDYLHKYTTNQQLIDTIAQHFFEATPAFFALSYFTIYFDYHYPRGGTGMLPEALKDFIANHGGSFALDTAITSVNPETRQLIDHQGNEYTYDELIWAADTNLLYRLCDLSAINKKSIRNAITAARTKFHPLKGADSVLTLYLGIDLPLSTLREKVGPHAFITPSLEGQSTHPISKIKLSDNQFTDDFSVIAKWINHYLEITTYEVALPGLRDESLAPLGQSGLIISVLFDYQLTKHIIAMKRYDELKRLVEAKILAVFSALWNLSLVDHKVISQVATPVTIERYTNNTEGSLSGWSFTNRPFPVTTQFMKVTSSVRTSLPHVTQCGQWTFNPAGIPVAVMTGKLAVDAVIKKIKPTKKTSTTS